MFITKFSIINTENNEEMTDKIWTASGQDLANYQVQIVKNWSAKLIPSVLMVRNRL